MATNKEPRVSMTVSDAAELLGAYDDWKGSLHPDEQDEYLARFNRLRNRVCKLLGDAEDQGDA